MRAIRPALILCAAVAIGAGAVLAAGARLQVFFAADFKDQAYQQAVYQKVAAAWKRPPKNPRAGNKTVVIAVIQRDGKAPEPRLHHHSGTEAWDTAALDAVKNAASFPPLPRTYAPASVEVHFHFEYVE